MDEKFQDRIDDYLLGRMPNEEIENFLQEIEQDKDKKEQLEFTKNVKESVCSRKEKLRILAQFQKQYEEERKISALRPTGSEHRVCYSPAPATAAEQLKKQKNRKWLWISSVAAVLVVGFFAIKPMFVYDSSPIRDSSPNVRGTLPERMRGGDEIFTPTQADSTANDTIMVNIKKKATTDE